MKAAVVHLVESKAVTFRTAMAAAPNPSDFDFMRRP